MRFLVFLLVLFSSNVTAAAGEPSAPTLCILLENILPGEQKAVEVSGVYWVSFEHAFLSEPRTPLCSLDVQPVTWVTFSEDFGAPDVLRELSEGRWYVTFRGVLFGPGLVETDDRSIPVVGAFANRTAFDRYGHLNSFRTKLVVNEVVGFSPVPRSVEHSFFIGRPEIASAPSLRDAQLPEYPDKARRAGIEGIVEMKVVVAGGSIESVEHVSGDRILYQAGRANLASWRFDSNWSGHFLTRFEYRLELRELGANPNTRYELMLPYSVKLVAPVDGW